MNKISMKGKKIAKVISPSEGGQASTPVIPSKDAVASHSSTLLLKKF